MAALLTSTKSNKDRTAVYLNECRTMGVEVLAPCVNRSEMDFVARDETVPFGLSAIRNVGEAMVQSILDARAGRPFVDLSDFVDRVDLSVLNKRTIESLIKAGAFDAMGYTRRGLMMVFEQVLDATVTRRRAEEMGQFSLFGGADSPIETEAIAVPELTWEKRTRLSFEKEMLGLYVSDHPLLGVGGSLRQHAKDSIPGLEDMRNGDQVSIAGVVSTISRRYTRKGEPMVFFELEDLEGAVEVICFPKMVAEIGPLVRADAILVVRGRLDHRGDSVKVVSQEIFEPNLSEDSVVRVQVAATRLSKTLVADLKGVLANHPGTAPVFLHMTNDGSAPKVLRLGDEFAVEPRSALYAELKELLGSRALI